MAIVVKANAKNADKLNLLNSLDEILRRQCIIKHGTSMMYIAGKGFKTRGEHSEEVAEIGSELARRLGGDVSKARREGIAHDFGHTVFAHSGESAFARFLAKQEGVEDIENISTREFFDHSQHGVKALKITCARLGIRIPEELLNAIEAHSSGSNSKGKVKCESFEAECIMRADKIASSISDTQDMIKAGAFDLSDESLSNIFDNNDTIREIIGKRIFSDYKKNEKAFDEMLNLVIALDQANIQTIGEIKNSNDPNKASKIFALFDEVKNKQIDNYITEIKKFIKLPAEEQRKRMVNLILDGVECENKKIDVTPRQHYSEEYPDGQLYVAKMPEAILAGLRGLLVSMEEQRKLGKLGPESEALVETVADYIYANKKDFENKWPFKNWKKDEDSKKIEWKNQVIFGLAQMQDEQFGRFAKKLLNREDAKEAMKNCKYRDPRDTAYMKKHPGIRLPLSTYDFSTEENIDEIYDVDVNREYNPPMYEEFEKYKASKREVSMEK